MITSPSVVLVLVSSWIALVALWGALVLVRRRRAARGVGDGRPCVVVWIEDDEFHTSFRNLSDAQLDDIAKGHQTAAMMKLHARVDVLPRGERITVRWPIHEDA